MKDISERYLSSEGLARLASKCFYHNISLQKHFLSGRDIFGLERFSKIFLGPTELPPRGVTIRELVRVEFRRMFH